MKSQKLLDLVCYIEGEKVILEPFSYRRMLSFYTLYKTSYKKWEQFVTLNFRGLDDVRRFIAQQTQNDAFVGYFILNKKSFKPVGFILGDEISDSEIAITFAIGVQYEKCGYAYEARRLFEDMSKEAGYASMVCFCDAENTRSVELLLRDGYQGSKIEKIDVGSVSMDLEVYCKLL